MKSWKQIITFFLLSRSCLRQLKPPLGSPAQSGPKAISLWYDPYLMYLTATILYSGVLIKLGARARRPEGRARSPWQLDAEPRG